ncbi:MAG: cysteine desulfurase NifS [Methanomassiliicoccales archaeon]|jgi:cysteine desulfurase|nr:cysteine desulfurase NifS [Methanomassiliicoccales archaeon]
MPKVYFDNSATTRVDPKVVEAMLPFFDEKFGNASSLHSFGREAQEAMEEARRIVAKALNATSREIIFTSGGTESDNLAIQGIAFANKDRGNHIITSAIEHHAVLHTCRFLESQGFSVTYLPVSSEGIVSEEAVKEAMTRQTILVSVMAANNEIGTIQPIRAIGEIAHDHKTLFHTDAVQAFMKMPIDVVKDSIDLLSLSAHKIHGPKGVGALYVRNGVKIRPIMYGGGHERGLRSSTENVSGIVGLGKAVEIGMRSMIEDVEKMKAMRERIIDGVLSRVSDSYLNGHRYKRLCNNANFRFDFVEGEALVLQLDMRGIATSTGSACSTKDLEPSHVLLACGLRPEQARGSLRVSLSRMNTFEEVNYFLDVIPEAVRTLREISPIRSW